MSSLSSRYLNNRPLATFANSRDTHHGSTKMPLVTPGITPMTKLGDLISDRSCVALGRWFQTYKKAA